MKIDGWSSHLPILKRIAEKYKIERILELGIGKYSTKIFNDKEAFPDLIELVSVEDNPEWVTKVSSEIPMRADIKMELIIAEKDKTFKEVNKMDLSRFDLIFIDDSKSMNARRNTIRTISNKKPDCIVVIHDFHVPRYQEVAKYHYISKIDNHFKPNPVSTGVMSNKIDIRSLKDEISILKEKE